MMNCMIIEDEIPAQRILKNYIDKVPNLELIDAFNTSIDANRFLNSKTVDIIFLDINLPDISGFDFIKTVENPPKIIITTAYPEYAVDSFELETIIDYLVKPFSFDRFLKAFHKAKNTIEKETNNSLKNDANALFINVDKTMHKILMSDIVHVESDRNYITVVTKVKKLTYIDSLKNWTAKLPQNQFIQVHKSFIINTAFVEKISGNEVHVNKTKIPIGRTYKQNLLQQLKIV